MSTTDILSILFLLACTVATILAIKWYKKEISGYEDKRMKEEQYQSEIRNF